MADKHIPDHEHRAQALDPTQSFICEAPAGSGKTELLTQRLLILLDRVQQPEEILAITFTRKAAAEMRYRVVESLRRAASGEAAKNAHQALTLRLANAVVARDRAQGWCLMDSPSRLQIKTFDSLCASLANSLPLHSSFSSPPQVTDDARELYIAATHNFLASLEDQMPWADSLATVMTLLDNNIQKVENLLVAMLSRRDTWLPLLGRGAEKHDVIRVLESNLQVVRNESVDKVKRDIPRNYRQQWVALAAFAANNLNHRGIASPLEHCRDMDVGECELPDASLKGGNQWSGLTTLLLSKTGSWRKKLDVNCGFPAKGDTADDTRCFKEKKSACMDLIHQLSDIPGLHEKLLDVCGMPSATYDDDQKQLLSALIDVLPVLSAYLSVMFQEKSSVDFSEVSMRAGQALGALDAPSDLAMALDYKIQHILVDEFQDTSPSQLELLTQLTSGWEAGDGRTLFCVGDAMQSIYGFRNSNVGLFLQCIEQGLGSISLKPLRLRTNFRSQCGVVDWINHVFSRAFPATNDIDVGAVSYSASVAYGEAQDDNAVQVHGLTDEHAAHQEAQTIVDIIQQTQQAKPDATIAILVRNRNHASHITPLLSRAGLNYRAVELEPLSQNMLVQDLMALTHAILFPADRIAWLSVLRSPYCGLSLADLEVIVDTNIPGRSMATIFQQLKYLCDVQADISDEAEGNQSQVLQADLFIASEMSQGVPNARRLTPDGMMRIDRVYPILQRALHEVQRKSLRQSVEGTWLALGGPACLDSQQEIKNARLFFSLLENLDSVSILNTRDSLENAVNKLFALPDPESDEKLQVMTIHKSKGLEFDTVIVPSLHRQPRSQDPELLRWHERLTASRDRHLIMSPISSSGKQQDSVYAYLSTQQKRREYNETSRLLYVACTRAQRRLHLLTFVQADKKKPEQWKTPTKGSLLLPIWDSVKPSIRHPIVPTEEPSPHDGEQEKHVLQRLQLRWQMPDLPQGNLLAPYIPFFRHDNQQARPSSPEDHLPRIVGTFVHRLLKSLDEPMLDSWRSEGIEQYRPYWRSQLRQFSLPSGQLDEAAARVIETMEKVIDDTSTHWLFSNSLPLRKAEFSLNVSSTSEETQLIVDLLIFDGTDTWVVDYKTSQPDESEVIDDFLSREKRYYKSTMLRYKKAVQNLGYQSVRLALYFPMINTWSEYSE